jgi:4-hydroxybenzoate polyprenyltransferase
LKTIAGIITIIRPLNGVVAAASLLPALTLATGKLGYNWHAGAVLFLLVSFGYVVNDIYDITGDRENSQQRPLVRGQLSISGAWLLAATLALTALGLSLLHSLALGIYCAVLLVALFAYAAYLSTVLVVSNLWVAAMCASVFYLPVVLPGYYASDAACQLLAYAVILSFLYHFAREIVKDIEDMRGDLAMRRATLPLLAGAARSRLIAGIILLLMLATSYFVYFQEPRQAYLLIVTLGVNLPIALIFLLYLRRDPSAWAGRVSIALKIIMLPALAALLVLGVN